jgi:sugar lactone lactonase YvrE
VDGVVSSFAGTVEGFSDGTDQAAFNSPSGLALDQAGNLLVADTGNNAIRKVTPQGVVTTLAGDGVAGYRDGPAGQARFNGPIGIAIDRAGTIFVADSYNDRIRAITSTGEVTSLAGDGVPGFQDGPAALARFDTPGALLVDGYGALIVADTGNDALRVVDPSGQVRTLIHTAAQDNAASFRRPISLAGTPDGYLYIGTLGRGRIFQLAPSGEMRGLTGLDIDIPRGDDLTLRIAHASGLAVDSEGKLTVADSASHRLLKLVPRRTGPSPDRQQSAQSITPAAAIWPVNPDGNFHEIVGTMGEVRGNDQGESRDHFHGGLDIQANLGTPVHAIVGAKVSEPLPNWSYDGLGEGIAIGPISYIHLRVGRRADGSLIDPGRLGAVKDGADRPRIRVKRGTRFAVGEVLGTVNRMYHVHLEFSPDGANRNPLQLPFSGIADHIAPRIEAITLLDGNGVAISAKRGARLLVPASAGDISIVATAYDQCDGNAVRRRLGLYKIGYQLLTAAGTPLPGFEHPLITLEFNQLPPDREAVKLAFADGSGETVHGSDSTRFSYLVTNRMRDGHGRGDVWKARDLPRGDYVIRIFAADYAGNIATAGRDLPVTLE